MRKNKVEEIEIKWKQVNKGNWNFRDKTKKSVNTKPIAVMQLGDDEFVWKHSEIIELIRWRINDMC